MSFASKSPSSVVIRLNGLPTNPVSFGSFSSSMKTLETILLDFNIFIDFFIREAAFTFVSYEDDTSIMVLFNEIINATTAITDRIKRVDVF